MTIDPRQAVGGDLPATVHSWDARDVILYHLGLNIGAAPADLRYVYEQGLVVLPSFAVLPALPTAAGFDQVPGLGLDRSGEVHGEHELTVFGPLPVSATVTTTGRVSAVHDKGRSAVVVLDTESRDDSGNLLCRNQFTAFLRGAGGFRGSVGPITTPEPTPERAPDRIVASRTLPQQALLYRLSGDLNPLHADPAVAADAGFDRPILHGLATFGIVLKAVLDAELDGDAGRVRSYRARFAGIVYPGETLETAIWRTRGGVFVAARTRERGTTVLAPAFIGLTGGSDG